MQEQSCQIKATSQSTGIFVTIPLLRRADKDIVGLYGSAFLLSNNDSPNTHNQSTMTLDQFCSLHADQQRLVVQHKGVFLLTRSAVGLSAKLYQVDGFYVELLVDERQATIGRLNAFVDMAKLEPYLWQVDVSKVHRLLR